jgi:uncharacterized membrane protein YebE (DUF533 family)
MRRHNPLLRYQDRSTITVDDSTKTVLVVAGVAVVGVLGYLVYSRWATTASLVASTTAPATAPVPAAAPVTNSTIAPNPADPGY